MAVNYLHIWPRQTFMLIALPNQVRLCKYMDKISFESNLSTMTILGKEGSDHFRDMAIMERYNVGCIMFHVLWWREGQQFSFGKCYLSPIKS